VFAPSEQLLSEYKSGSLSWKAYEERYLSEMRALYRKSPQPFMDLLRREAVTLVCYEAQPDRCHRRLLAELLAKIGKVLRIQVELDIR
jgi:uncharacterized protein YeaO (DUF488 family)